METHNEGTPETGEKQAPQKKDKKMMWIIIAVVVLLLIFFGRSFSPERAAERAIEQATNGQYDINVNEGGNSIQVTGENGETVNIGTGKSASIPDTWPKSIPIMSGARIGYTAEAQSENDSTGHSIMFEVDSSAADVTNYYKDALSKNGWNIDGTMSTGDGSVISATNENDEGVAVYIAETDGVTSVSISTEVAN